LPEHDVSLRGGVLAWLSGGPSTYFQTNFAPLGPSLVLYGNDTLELRVDRANSNLNESVSTDFSVQLVDATNTPSAALPISQFVHLTGPVGGPGGLHSMLQTARIPLAAFGVRLENTRGVRLTFDKTPTGAILVANIRASKGGATANPVADAG